jgi:micrococcal nuclease
LYEYKVKVTRVVDGDTFDGVVDLGFKITTSQRFRLHGIDTPETWRPKTEEEYIHGMKAYNIVKELIEGKTITINSIYLGVYNRYGCIVTLPDGRDLTTILKESGMEKKEQYGKEI